MRRYVAISVLLSTACLSLSATFAQQGQRNASSTAPPDVDPTLWRVLEFWESRSSRIKRLDGDVLRRTYDKVFKVETLGHGQFFYQAPDNGRLDMNPVEITKKMLEEREKPGARVMRGPDGKPFALESALPEKWVCDGEQLITVHEEDKSADVIALPKELRGQNIMNGPLPFLFGLPPAEAIKRFDLKLVEAPTKAKPIAVLTAFPKRRDDQQNWIEATIRLDTRTGLPSAIQLIDPAKTKTEVYSFADMQVNPGIIRTLWTKTPFKLNLSKYNVNIHNADAMNGAGDQPMAKATTVPDLIGMSHKAAQAQLHGAGLSQERISIQRGPVARRPQDVYRVMEQNPPAGTPLRDVKIVALKLWTDPKRR
jgi:TIGR03009 family protein